MIRWLIKHTSNIHASAIQYLIPTQLICSPKLSLLRDDLEKDRQVLTLRGCTHWCSLFTLNSLISAMNTLSDRPIEANIRTSTYFQQPPATVPIHTHHGGSEELSTEAGKPDSIRRTRHCRMSSACTREATEVVLMTRAIPTPCGSF